MRFSIIGLAFLASAAAAQTPDTITATDYARAERFLGTNTVPLVTSATVRPNWLPDGRFWYRSTTSERTQAFMVDPQRRTRVAVPEPSISAEPASPNQPPPNSSVSPNGKRAAFIRDYNLWMKDLGTGREVQLTTDGVKDYGYATNNAGWITSPSPVLTWSPDSRKIATFQHDGRRVNEMYLVTTNIGAPRLLAWKYPLVGDSAIFMIRRVVIDVDAAGGPKVIPLQIPPDAHRSTVTDHVTCSGGIVCDLQWFPDGSHFAFVSSSRDHKHGWMRVADASSGAVRTLFEETSATQIGDAGFNENLWRVLPASNELIWWSQRDNWIHLYLYDLTTGQLKNRITAGDGNVDDIILVDEKTRTLYFTGLGKEPGRDPYFRHFYKVGFNGRGQTLLTPDVGDHTVQLSPDGRTFIDTYSTPTTPPVTALRDVNGRLLLQLEKADISRLTATGWRPPTPITVKGRDGATDIYGLLYTPTHLDSTRKYPVVNYVYPEPMGTVGSRSFAPARGDHQALAELGFVVVTLDGMGTTRRSRAFQDATYGKMGDNTIPDQIAGIRDLARRYRWIDTTRVGIWGHSGGGFATASAMFRFPDFYKVGISESGNHDNRNYEDDWGERYQGLLRGNNYADQATPAHAANLKGKLLLAHGGLDTNVPPYNTYLVLEALQRANKDYDLILFPNTGHGFGQYSNYMMRRRWDYFVRNLMGAEPPKEYQIGGARR